MFGSKVEDKKIFLEEQNEENEDFEQVFTTKKSLIITIHFDSIFKNNIVGESFHEFLKTEFNEEPWNFLKQVEAYKKIQKLEHKIVKIEEILTEYINPYAEHEINISGKSKIKLISNFEKQRNFQDSWVLEGNENEFFKEITNIVCAELYHDPWKRYLRSEEGEKIVQKFKKDSSICSPLLTDTFHYKDDYFTNPWIEDRDFNFCKILFEDAAHWEVNNNKFLIEIVD
jgi:hypothetical protein